MGTCKILNFLLSVLYMLTGFSKQQLSSEVDNKIHDSLTNKYWVIDIAFERLGKNEKEESTHSLPSWWAHTVGNYCDKILITEFIGVKNVSIVWVWWQVYPEVSSWLYYIEYPFNIKTKRYLIICVNTGNEFATQSLAIQSWDFYNWDSLLDHSFWCILHFPFE